MSFNGYDLHNHRGLELSDYSQGVNHARYFYDPEGMKRDVQKEEQRRPSHPPFMETIFCTKYRYEYIWHGI